MTVSIVRTVILYLFITVAIRLMGKRQIGDMQPNELVVTLLISEIAAIPLQDPERPLMDGIAAIFMLVVLEIILSVLLMKSHAIRKIMSGSSVVIIQNGEIDQKAMRKVRMTVLDLIELLRAQEVFDLSTVGYAVLEVNGELSVLLKSDQQPPTKADLSLACEPAMLSLPIISDGTVMAETMQSLGITRHALNEILKKENRRPQDIFLMMIDRNLAYTIVPMKEKP